VKPSSLASSAGINDDSLVKTPEEARKRAERIWRRFGTTALCDEFVVGREFRISMIEASATSIKRGAIIEWHFGTGKPGWGFRTEAIRINGRVQRLRQVTRDLADLPRRKTEEITAMVRTAMKVLDIQGYSTIDLRMDDQERVSVIEVNSNPGLWSGSRLWTNPSFEVTLKKIVAAAFRRE
jgi:D-alanine-D-alanine ligase-like ATP-grasp enzyme